MLKTQWKHPYSNICIFLTCLFGVFWMHFWFVWLPKLHKETQQESWKLEKHGFVDFICVRYSRGRNVKNTMETFTAPNPYLKGDRVLKYVGMSSFGQKRQISIPLVVNVYNNGKFETLFVAEVD